MLTKIILLSFISSYPVWAENKDFNAEQPRLQQAQLMQTLPRIDCPDPKKSSVEDCSENGKVVKLAEKCYFEIQFAAEKMGELIKIAYTNQDPDLLRDLQRKQNEKYRAMAHNQKEVAKAIRAMNQEIFNALKKMYGYASRKPGSGMALPLEVEELAKKQGIPVLELAQTYSCYGNEYGQIETMIEDVRNNLIASQKAMREALRQRSVVQQSEAAIESLVPPLKVPESTPFEGKVLFNEDSNGTPQTIGNPGEATIDIDDSFTKPLKPLDSE